MSADIGKLIEQFYMTGRWEALELECRALLERDPADTEATYILAETVLALGRTPEATVLFRMLAEGTGEARFHARLGWTLEEAGELDAALDAFRIATQKDHNLTGEAVHYENLMRCRERLDDAIARRTSRPTRPGPGFFVCHANRSGFFSEFHNALGCLLAAELDGREPHVFWGETSLFSEGPRDNAFARLFVSHGMASSEVVEAAARSSVFPNEWAGGSVLGHDILGKARRTEGVSAQDLMFREPSVVVGASYTGVHVLRHLLPDDDCRRDWSTVQLQRALFAERLRPAADLADRAADFAARRFGGAPFLAVHVRGTDKQLEQGDELSIVNAAIWEATARKLAEDPERRLFLLTDDVAVVGRFEQAYGSRVVTTGALRGSGVEGAVHLAKASPRRRIGEEILVDALIATRAHEFIGNRWSNVACGVRTLRSWESGTLHLFGSDDASVNYHAPFVRR